MAEKATKPLKETKRQAPGLASWEGEGGARSSPRALADAERQTLERLGLAVVMEWNELPTELQRVLFRRASAAEQSYDPVQLRSRLARFLHDHKDDAADS
jgi:hypothetical protein